MTACHYRRRSHPRLAEGFNYQWHGSACHYQTRSHSAWRLQVDLDHDRGRAIFRMPRSSDARRLRWALLRLLQLQGRAFDPAVVNAIAFDETLRELKLN
jgi:hypothetical protein